MIQYIKKLFKLGCYNPKSDKYYKGFRYRRINNYELWCDGNNVCRKLINYQRNSYIYYIEYKNEKYQKHNEDGPAYLQWDEEGDLIFKFYFLDGKKLSEQEWKEKTGNFSKDELINYYLKHEMYEEIIKLQNQ